MNPTTIEPGKNTGLIAPAPRPTDFIGGVESAITYEARVADGNWEKFRPTDEWQRRNVAGVLGYDTMCCTNFSCMNSIELQLEMLRETGALSNTMLNKMRDLGYFDENDKFNFSDWFNAKTSGTTLQFGNTLQAPWDAVRKYGLLPQSAGPNVNDFKRGEDWFAKEVTPAQYELALEFLNLLDVKYEWTVLGTSQSQDAMRIALKQSPLHIATPVCATWNSGDVHPDGRTQLDHATGVIMIEPNGTYHDLDHYSPFEKKLSADYFVAWAIKGVVTVKPAGTYTPTQLRYTFSKKLTYEYLDDNATKLNPAVKNDPTEVNRLQKVLQFLKRADGTTYMKVGVFGRFGPATRTALSLFQQDHGIVDPDKGKNFGPQTRDAMNALLLK